MDYLDSNGLSYYDSKIKGYTNDIIETSVLPMIPKKGVVSPTSEGWVSGSQVYNAIGSGGGGGTVTAEYPFPYVKVKKCKKFCTNSTYISYNTDTIVTILDLHTSNTSISPVPIAVRNINGCFAMGSNISSDTGVAPFTDSQAFDAMFFLPPQASMTTPSDSHYPSSALYTSEGEMEIHKYRAIRNEWMQTLTPSVLRIDDMIQYIGSKAFKNITNITLYISAVEPPVIQSDTFYGFTAIHVPSGSLDLYKSANNWSAYGDYMIGDL